MYLGRGRASTNVQCSVWVCSALDQAAQQEDNDSSKPYAERAGTIPGSHRGPSFCAAGSVDVPTIISRIGGQFKALMPFVPI